MEIEKIKTTEVLPLEFEGKGEVKGFLFTQVKKTDDFYIYRVNSGSKIYFEIFKRIAVAKCIDPVEHVYSENEFKEIYPKANNFGFWAWTYSELCKAENKLNELTNKQKN